MTVRAATIAAPPAALKNVSYSAPAATMLIGMLRDRKTLIFNNSGFSAAQIGVSTNGGATITYGKSFGSQYILSGVLETPNGEVLAAIKGRTAEKGELWRSTGWNKATGNATTWTKVLSSSGANGIFDNRWTLNEGCIAPEWSRRAGVIFTAEYGTLTKNATTIQEGAIRAWMSTNDGVSWTEIFNLANKHTDNPTGGYHIHAIAYDPWDDRVYISNGDGGAGYDGASEVWAINGEDLGDASKAFTIPGTVSSNGITQVTTISPDPAGITLTTDSNPAGVRLMSRNGFRNLRAPIQVLPIGGFVIGAHAYKLPGVPNAPRFMSYASTTVSGPPSIYASVDGITYTEVHRESAVATGTGINTVVGPDVNGKVYANRNMSGTSDLLAADYAMEDPFPKAAVAASVTVTADQASRYGLLAHTCPVHIANSTSTALTTGTLFVQKVRAEEAAVSGTRTVRMWQVGAASGLTLAQAAVFDSAGVKLGSDSADQSATINAGGTANRSFTVGSFALDKGADYYVAFLFVGTTGPSVARSGGDGRVNAGLSGASLLWASGGTGLTAVPASITPGSLSSQALAIWAGLL